MENDATTIVRQYLKNDQLNYQSWINEAKGYSDKDAFCDYMIETYDNIAERMCSILIPAAVSGGMFAYLVSSSFRQVQWRNIADEIFDIAQSQLE